MDALGAALAVTALVAGLTGPPAGNQTVLLTPANSYPGAVSPDGRYVVFESGAALVPDDTNNAYDVFVRDRRTGTTSLVSVATTAGSGSGTISADARYVAFWSRDFGVSVRDRRTGTTRDIDADGFEPAISANGRYVVFSGPSAGPFDMIRYDLATGATDRIPTGLLPDPIDGNGPQPHVSADGQIVAYTGAEGVVTAHNFRTGTTRTFGTGRAGAISGDGRTVVWSDGSNVYANNRLVSVAVGGGPGDGPSYGWMTASHDGRLIGFGSVATNLVPADTNGYLDVFVRDMRTHRTIRASESRTGGNANGESLAPVISADGRVLVFASFAGNITETGLGGDQWLYARTLR
ncbi:PD40 domain-containing protein [Paractinoplanes lichenicola]|uniref:PD40 domain-containing protein n=1 Tax=Paractinoplanes lichenicola TaxID=2802976 RepID=A0ABS1W0I8_9ACTN|nr:PD40 domain-containing protein [Actinoplanes lichenicola]MBL7260240.1 PD40 domain-containing protein [Actinoplanes lichenicola]